MQGRVYPALSCSLLAAVLAAGCAASQTSTFPAPIYGDVQVRVGERVEPGTPAEVAEPALGTSTGRLAVLPFQADTDRTAHAMEDVLRTGLIMRTSAMAARLGEDRCAGRTPCFFVLGREETERALTPMPLESATPPGGPIVPGEQPATSADPGRPTTLPLPPTERLVSEHAIELLITGQVESGASPEVMLRALRASNGEVVWARRVTVLEETDLVMPVVEALLPSEGGSRPPQGVPLYRTERRIVGFEQHVAPAATGEARFVLGLEAGYHPWPETYSASLPSYLGVLWASEHTEHYLLFSPVVTFGSGRCGEEAGGVRLAYQQLRRGERFYGGGQVSIGGVHGERCEDAYALRDESTEFVSIAGMAGIAFGSVRLGVFVRAGIADQDFYEDTGYSYRDGSGAVVSVELGPQILILP